MYATTHSDSCKHTGSNLSCEMKGEPHIWIIVVFDMSHVLNNLGTVYEEDRREILCIPVCVFLMNVCISNKRLIPIHSHYTTQGSAGVHYFKCTLIYTHGNKCTHELCIHTWHNGPRNEFYTGLDTKLKCSLTSVHTNTISITFQERIYFVVVCVTCYYSTIQNNHFQTPFASSDGVLC